MDMRKLLELAKCPNAECCHGAIPYQVDVDEWAAEQCQWCAERDEALSHIGDGSKAEAVDVDVMAAFIREIDGNNRMGAGQLAERICDRFYTHAPTAQDSKVPKGFAIEKRGEDIRVELLAGTDRGHVSAWVNPGDGFENKILYWLAHDLLSAAPVPDKPQWISCAKRLPTVAESWRWLVWAVRKGCTRAEIVGYEEVGPEEFICWTTPKPQAPEFNGLQRPAAPEGE